MEQNEQCGVVNYGSNGTCKEMRMILNGSAFWLYKMIDDNGEIKQGNVPTLEIGETINNSTIAGITLLIQLLDKLNIIVRVNSLKGGLDGNTERFYINDIQDKLLFSLQRAVERITDETAIELSNIPFLTSKIKVEN